MENYYFTDHLVVKVTNPTSDFKPSVDSCKTIEFDYITIPTLYVFAKAVDLDKLEKILNELTAHYIYEDKLHVYLIDGDKGNRGFTKRSGNLPEAGILFATTEYPEYEMELFSILAKGAEMTKDRLKIWLDRHLIFINKNNRYRNETPLSSYIVVENDQQELKLWPDFRKDIPAGWEEIRGSYNQEDKASCIRFIEELKAERQADARNWA
jgi:uncharacterized protein YbdZ (MbtH family)